MLDIRLCYEQADEKGKTQYLMPSKFPKQAPTSFQREVNSHPIESCACRLRIHFEPFIPAGTVNRLIVKHHSNALHQWRSNVVLQFPKGTGSRVYLKENWKEHAIEVFFPEGGCLDTLNLLLASIHEDLQSLKSRRAVGAVKLEIHCFLNNEWVSHTRLKYYKRQSSFAFLFPDVTKEEKNTFSMIQELKDLLEDGKWTEALSQMEEQLDLDQQSRNTLTNLRRQVKEYDRDRLAHTSPADDLRRRGNDLHNRLVGLIDLLESELVSADQRPDSLGQKMDSITEQLKEANAHREEIATQAQFERAVMNRDISILLELNKDQEEILNKLTRILEESIETEQAVQAVLDLILAKLRSREAGLPEPLERAIKEVETVETLKLDAKAKLKMTLPIIPGILKYESELSSSNLFKWAKKFDLGNILF